MEYIINLTILFCIYGILALSLNLVVGMAGLLSLAQAAFYGIGAYATAIGMVSLELSFISTIFLGIAINSILAFVVGKILSRFQGDYYAIVSAGLSIIVFSVLLNWKAVTNGPLGIFGISKPEILGLNFHSNASFLSLSLIFLILAYGIYVLIDKSSFGRTLKAIREDEKLAQVMGYKAKHFKSIIFVISAAMSGVAGAIFASYIAFIAPSTFQLKEGIFMIPQGKRVFKNMSVLDNIELATHFWQNRNLFPRRLEEVLIHFPDLRARLNDLAGNLSGGQQQMVALARGLINQPKMVLLDEPSIGLSPKLINDTFHKIKELKDSLGTAFIIVEHNLKTLLPLTDYAYILEQGQVAYNGPSEGKTLDKMLSGIFKT